mgnify:CR=1 FL=1
MALDRRFDRSALTARTDSPVILPLAKATGLDRANIHRALRKLEAREIVVVSRDNRK